MMPFNLFRLQLMETFGSLKHAVIRISISILLALPFILVNMPARAKASGLVMVVLFTSFFGSAIAQSRLREDGRFSRLIVLPIPKHLLWLDLILSSVVSRILPTLIVLAGFIIFNSPILNPALMIHLTALLCTSILFLVSLGMLTGQVIRNNGQVHLFSALICGVIAFLSGIIPAVQKVSWLINITGPNPLNRLLTSLTTMINGNTTIPTLQLVFSSITLCIIALLVIQRWLSGAGCCRINEH